MDINDKVLVSDLEQLFTDIIKRHYNGKWTLEEMKWIIFVRESEWFNNLSEQEQWVIRNYLDALSKIY